MPIITNAEKVRQNLWNEAQTAIADAQSAIEKARVALSSGRPDEAAQVLGFARTEVTTAQQACRGLGRVWEDASIGNYEPGCYE